MLPNSLKSFQILKYYQSEPKFNGVYSRKNLSEINDRVYVIHFEEYESIGTHWIALCVNNNNNNNNNTTYFAIFIVEHIKKVIGNKKLKQISINTSKPFDNV